MFESLQNGGKVYHTLKALYDCDNGESIPIDCVQCKIKVEPVSLGLFTWWPNSRCWLGGLVGFLSLTKKENDIC